MRKLNHFFVLLAVVCFGLSRVQAQTTLLEQTLLTQESFDTFTDYSVTGTQNWYFSAQYGAVCSGFSGGQSYANEDWLISPTVNLQDVDNVKLTFSHTRGNANVMNVGVTDGWYKAYATASYTGNPATTTWVELTGLNQNITNAWQYVSSGELTVPEAAKSQSSRIAFRYISSATASATWEIKNVKITGEPQVTNPGSGGTFKITNWNTEWLGCAAPDSGPSDETRQLNNVITALRSMDSDIFCLQEVINTSATRTVESIVTALGSAEWGGALIELTSDCTQRQVIIYKKARVQFVSAFELSGGISSQGNSYSYNWSTGRFPAVYNVNLISGTNIVPVTLVNIHAKADAGADSYTRRLGGSIGLKTILDGASYNAKNVIVIGDYNDYLTGTQSSVACQCTDSPYKNFMDDTANYTALTANFSPRIIENIIISNELADNYVAGSVSRQTNMPQLIPGYYSNTSDHLPVNVSFQFDTMGVPSVTANNTWTMYPNPVKNVLNINISGMVHDTAVQVYDVTGRQVLAGTLYANTINVSALPSGMYILKMDGKSGKFIKQ